MFPSIAVVAALALVSAGHVYGLADSSPDVARPGRYLARRGPTDGAPASPKGTDQPLIVADEAWKAPPADTPLVKVLEHWFELLPAGATVNSIEFFSVHPVQKLEDMQNLKMVWNITQTGAEHQAAGQETFWYRELTGTPDKRSVKQYSAVAESSGNGLNVDKAQLWKGPLNITKVFDFYQNGAFADYVEPLLHLFIETQHSRMPHWQKLIKENTGVTSIQLHGFTSTDLHLGWRFHTTYDIYARAAYVYPFDIMYYEPQNGQTGGNLLALDPEKLTPKYFPYQPMPNYNNYRN